MEGSVSPVGGLAHLLNLRPPRRYVDERGRDQAGSAPRLDRKPGNREANADRAAVHRYQTVHEHEAKRFELLRVSIARHVHDRAGIGGTPRRRGVGKRHGSGGRRHHRQESRQTQGRVSHVASIVPMLGGTNAGTNGPMNKARCREATGFDVFPGFVRLSGFVSKPLLTSVSRFPHLTTSAARRRLSLRDDSGFLPAALRVTEVYAA
jgi:hypothetical protein